MNRRVVFSSLALVALAGFLAWLLRAHWRQAKLHESEIFSRAARPKTLLPLPPIEAPKPVTAAEYFDVAQRTLFSRDRNPTVIVEVKPPPPKPPLPPLPAYYGQLALGDPAIFLSTGAAPQKIYHAGDKIGDKDKFVIVSFDREKITLRFDDETVEKKLEELRPKQAPPPQTPAAAATPPPQPAGSRTGALSSAGSLADATPEKKDDIIGADYGSGYHACVAGDTSAAGTIKDGYKKVVTRTLFGQDCHWETVK